MPAIAIPRWGAEAGVHRPPLPRGLRHIPGRRTPPPVPRGRSELPAGRFPSAHAPVGGLPTACRSRRGSRWMAESHPRCDLRPADLEDGRAPYSGTGPYSVASRRADLFEERTTSADAQDRTETCAYHPLSLERSCRFRPRRAAASDGMERPYGNPWPKIRSANCANSAPRLSSLLHAVRGALSLLGFLTFLLGHIPSRC